MITIMGYGNDCGMMDMMVVGWLSAVLFYTCLRCDACYGICY